MWLIATLLVFKGDRAASMMGVGRIQSAEGLQSRHGFPGEETLFRGCSIDSCPGLEAAGRPRTLQTCEPHDHVNRSLKINHSAARNSPRTLTDAARPFLLRTTSQ